MTTLLRARIAFHGATPLYDRRHLAEVLDLLEGHGFRPAKAGLDERKGKPYARDTSLALLREPPVPLQQTDLYLWASAPTAYSASLALWERAHIGIDFEPTPPPDRWHKIFELADALATMFQPDWGAVGVVVDARDDLKRDFANDDERDTYLLAVGPSLYRKDFVPRGPFGLAPRTYIGPLFAEQFGRDRIESMPVAVEKLDGGGYRVDLAANPWAADTSELLDGWRRGMAHLREANVFPIPELKFGYAMRWARGANYQPRRIR